MAQIADICPCSTPAYTHAEGQYPCQRRRSARGTTPKPATLTEALARAMFANEHDDAAVGATDEAWTEDADLRAFWTARSTRAIAFMAEWRVQARLAALPPACACGSTMTACFSTVEYESRRCCPNCTH